MALSPFNKSTWSISSASSINSCAVQDFLTRHHYPSQVCFIGEVSCDMVEAAAVFNLAVVTSDSGVEYIDDEQTLLVFSCFECEAFESIMQRDVAGRVMGAPAFLDAAGRKLELPLRKRPILSLTMKDIVVCFTGITSRSLALELMYMIRCMGGSVREDIGRSLTHIIAEKTSGPKYDYARTFTLPAMSVEWVFQCWKYRYMPGIHATDENLMVYRQKPFIDCKAAFWGFSPREEPVAVDAFVSNGGTVVLSDDVNCTHVIVDYHTKCPIPDNIPQKCLVVRSVWLWTCVQQIMRAPEDPYLLSKELIEKNKRDDRKRQWPSCACNSENKENSNRCSCNLNHAGYSCSSSAPSESSEYGATPAKLKKIECSISGIQELEETSSPKFDPALEFTRTSIVGHGISPQTESADKGNCGDLESFSVESISKRTATFLELLQTEENYGKILEVILGIRDEVLKKDQLGGPLLTETEAKVIFSYTAPVYEMHRTILHDLRCVKKYWKDSPSVGDVFNKRSNDLISVYRPYVTSYEESKKMIEECEARKPRFHAFTKIIRSRPECGRQALSDLMVRPVQRLGSTLLLLREMKKHTSSKHPDFQKLQAAVDSLDAVLSAINEDKKKLETLCSVFDIFNLIEFCPADIIASHRSLVLQWEAVQLTEDGPSQIGDFVMFFLFTDVLLFAKKKSKVVAMTKKPAEELTDKILKLAHGKPYKFLEVVPHSSVKRLVNVVDNQNIHNVFTLVTRGQDELTEVRRTFRLMDGCGDKVDLVGNWCRALAAHTCTTDPNSYLLNVAAEDCGITSSDVEETQIKKASRMMVRTQCLLGSVFGKAGNPGKPNNRLRTPSFNVNGLSPAIVKSPSYSSLTDKLVAEDDCQELKTSSLARNVAKKL